MQAILDALPNITYCENFDFFGISQPFNVFSNLSFFAVCMLAIARMAVKGYLYGHNIILIGLIWAIGVSSTIWHINLEKVWLFFDIMSIIFFIFAFQLVLFYIVYRFNFFVSFAIATAFLVLSWWGKSVIGELMPQASGGFVPLVIFLAGLAIYERSRTYMIALIYFVVALVARMIDVPTCSLTIIGTHFLWHSFCAVTVLYALKGLTEQYDEIGH